MLFFFLYSLVLGNSQLPCCFSFSTVWYWETRNCHVVFLSLQSGIGKLATAMLFFFLYSLVLGNSQLPCCFSFSTVWYWETRNCHVVFLSLQSGIGKLATAMLFFFLYSLVLGNSQLPCCFSFSTVWYWETRNCHVVFISLQSGIGKLATAMLFFFLYSLVLGNSQLPCCFSFSTVWYWETRNCHVVFLSLQSGIGKHNKMPLNFSFSSYHNTKLILSDKNISTHTRWNLKILRWSKSKLPACFVAFLHTMLAKLCTYHAYSVVQTLYNWVIPSESHTPTVEDYQCISQGEYQIQMGQPTGHFHMKSLQPLPEGGLFGRLNQHVVQRECGFQIELLNKPFHLNITLPQWKAYGKPSTVGVWSSNGVAHRLGKDHWSFW